MQYHITAIVSSLLFIAAASQPLPDDSEHFHHHHLHKREIQYVTLTSEVLVMAYITSTVWVPSPSQGNIPSSFPKQVQAPSTSDTLETPSESSSSAEETPTSPVMEEVKSSSSPFSPPSDIASPTLQSIVAAPSVPAPTTVQVPTSSQEPAPVPEPINTSSQESQAETSPGPVVAGIAAKPEPTPKSQDSSPQDSSSSSSSSSSSNSGDSSSNFSGEATFYSPGMGSCGISSTDTEMVAALAKGTMLRTDNGNPNNNPTCGKKVIVYSDSNSEGVEVTIVDTCPGCAGDHDLDLSPAAFGALGDPSAGRILITWHFA